jgi:quercetin dioxygenase-like cupin family protein
MIRTVIPCVLSVFLFSACASGPPKLPYPAFIQVDELEDVFMASLPGIRAKQMAGEPQTRRTSNRIDLPPDWSGTSGGSPGRSLEIFVVDGQITVGDVALGRGGYAFLPAGSLGFNLRSADGARILYFRNDVDPQSIIRTPIIIDAGLLEWQATAMSGVSIKELREDPGNGAKTWLLKIAPGASIPWQKSSALREGYLVYGDYQHSECVAGRVHTWTYTSGGYFYRPANTINGGPAAAASSESVWMLREVRGGMQETVPACVEQVEPI